MVNVSGRSYFIQIFHGEAEVMHNSAESAFGDVASGPRDGGKMSALGVPPDFMGAGSLSHKLATQLTEFPGQQAVGHSGTRTSI